MKWMSFVMKEISCRRLLGGYRTIRPLLYFSTTGRGLNSEHIVRSPFTPITIPEITIPQFIFKDLDRWSEKPAVVCGLTGRVLTYGDVRKMAKSIAASLKDLGLKRQAVIASVLPNVPEFPVIALGVMEAGMSFCPINVLYTPHEVVNQLLDSNSEAVITIPETVSAILEVKELLTTANKAQGEKLKVIVAPSLMGEEPEAPKGTIPLSQLITRVPEMPEEVENNEIAVIPYSSGTTGLPKGVCLTHRNVVSNLLQMQHKDIYDGRTEEIPDVIPCILPMFHIYGLVVVALQYLSSGSKLVTLPKFEITSFLKMLTDHEASILFAVPSIVLFLGSCPLVKKENLRTLRLIALSAAPCAETDIKACWEKAPQVRFMQGYGLTECAPGLLYQPLKWKNFGPSVGVPVPNTEIKVVDLETGASLPAGQRGEICAKGPNIMKEYLNNPTATKESIDKHGWLHTGDIGYYDEDGHFYIVDRVKELIKVKGFQVAPAELEELLRTHPAVRDAGVIGVKDAKLGERPVAFVAFHPEIAAPNIEELKGFVNSSVAHYKRIQDFIYTDNIERSPAGKILRRELKKIYLSKQDQM